MHNCRSTARRVCIIRIACVLSHWELWKSCCRGQRKRERYSLCFRYMGYTAWIPFTHTHTRSKAATNFTHVSPQPRLCVYVIKFLCTTNQGSAPKLMVYVYARKIAAVKFIYICEISALVKLAKTIQSLDATLGLDVLKRTSIS